MIRRPVLFFDSGIGGLSVLREARLKMPDYPFLYIADDAAFPYGAWEENALAVHIVELFSSLLKKYNPALIVLACNTASTLVLRKLRACYKDFDFVGTVPAVKVAAEQTFSGLISVLATTATINRPYTYDLIEKYAKHTQVNLVGSAHLAEYAEKYLQGVKLDPELVKNEILPCFIEKGDKRTDIIVLACTHYPFLVDYMRKLAPWPVDWINPAQAIAQQAYSLLQKQEFSNVLQNETHKDIACFTSNNVNFFKQRLLQGFGLELKEYA